MSSLLVVERMVIESLAKRKVKVKVEQIADDTGLSTSLIRSILFHLHNKRIIENNRGWISMNWANKSDWIHFIRDRDGVKSEIKELFSALVNQHFDAERKHGLKLKKAWLTDFECELLKGKLKELDEFVEGMVKNRKVQGKTKEQQILIWGISGYQNLVKELLHAV